jgi:2-C-methyl-D-erythritol 4-phosphate cytidylyltransferase
MNIALLLAGGVGSRLGAKMPKQFVEVNNKPIIIYTMEEFEKHEDIDKILVVCYEPFIPVLNKLAKKYNIRKYISAVAGGETGQESLYHGLLSLKNSGISDNDFVIVHDAVRPFVPHVIIDDLLKVAAEKGNACASLPCHETLIKTNDQIKGNSYIDRSVVRRVQTPQCFKFNELFFACDDAHKKGIVNAIYANTLMIDYGHTLYFSKGFSNNIKITTHDDIALFTALLTLKEDDLV